MDKFLVFLGVMVLSFNVSAANLSEGQIVKIIATANKGEIDAGQLASRNSREKPSKAFGQMMVKEHSKNDTKGKLIAKKNMIIPKDSSLNQELMLKSKNTITELKEARLNFDKMYIDSQVVMHQDVLNLIDDELLPNAKSEELISFLKETRHHVDMHLEEAKKLQAERKGL